MIYRFDTVPTLLEFMDEVLDCYDIINLEEVKDCVRGYWNF